MSEEGELNLQTYGDCQNGLPPHIHKSPVDGWVTVPGSGIQVNPPGEVYLQSEDGDEGKVQGAGEEGAFFS